MGLVDRAAVRDGNAGAPGVCLTLAWQLDTPVLAFEGNIRSAGSTLVWAAELLGISTQELADLAATLSDSRGLYVVPAFSGLGAPWWDANAVAIVSGFSFGATRAPLARAALESIAHQIADTLDAVRATGAPIEGLLVDGGPTRNRQLMQFEADMVGVPVERTAVAELSAMGAAHLAGLSSGLFTWEELKRFDRARERFEPRMNLPARHRERCAWSRAVARSRGLPPDEAASATK
jgi:glycerol kinase